jgi:hypothetical protein
MPPIRITLQHLKPELHTIGYPLHQHDAPIAGTGVSPPPNVLLDFMYGVAAYRRWQWTRHQQSDAAPFYRVS